MKQLGYAELLTSGDAALQLLQGVFKIRKAKPKAGCHQSGWCHPPALDDQLGLGSQQAGAQFQHPTGGGQRKSHTANAPEGPHHFAV